MKHGKYLIICLVVVLVFVFAFTGCASNNVVDNNLSTLSNETGMQFPKEEFDSDGESQGSENTNINNEDDHKMSSSEDDKNSSSENNNNTTSSQPSDETPSEVVEEEEDMSSDDVSKPTKNEDGSIKLPFDKW